MKNISNRYSININKNFVLGVEKTDNGYSFAIVSDNDEITLFLFKDDDRDSHLSIVIGKEYKIGNVFSVILKNIDLDGYSYVYMADGEIIVDPYAKMLTGLPEFSVIDNSGLVNVRGKIGNNRYDWKSENKPVINKEDLIIYKLHPRGFTMSPSSKVKYPGTFRGITEKIPYLKKLGINAVELMPAYEFKEYDYHFNYWGYNDGFYFAPKAAYSSCYKDGGDYTSEFKDMVKKFHINGIEVYMEFYFPREIYAGVVLDCLRYWKKEYHIDGAHLICDERVRLFIAEDPYIKDMRLIYSDWYTDCNNSNLIEYNEGFENVTRKLLKGDEGQLRDFVDAFKKNPLHTSVINFIADNNGFTLMDLVSYDRKHNEDNGEHNRDGKDYNISWNCGEEGSSTKRKVLVQRLRNRKNAMAFVLLAQGIPLIYSGDEFGNSQNGNNNTYCQDNETGWVDWSVLNKNRKFLNYVTELIKFRKEHKILHTEKELFQTDYKYYGLPDFSIHGSKAWYQEYENYNRHIGIMLCGKYAGDENEVYIGINMHWEKHTLALPKVPDKKWKVVINTNDIESITIEEERTMEVPPRSIVVLISEKNS